MQSLAGSYTAQELACIGRYLAGTIQVLRNETAKLTASVGIGPRE
jgi:hypothetical protein